MMKNCLFIFLLGFPFIGYAVPPHSTYHNTEYDEQRYPARRNYQTHLYESRQYYRPPPRKWFPQYGNYHYQINGPFHYSNYVNGPYPRGRSITPPNDREIYKQIERSLHGRDIGISVNGGNVSLEGVVNSQQEKQIIEDRISTMRGVFNIDNQIQVANTKAMFHRRLLKPKDQYGRIKRTY